MIRYEPSIPEPIHPYHDWDEEMDEDEECPESADGRHCTCWPSDECCHCGDDPDFV